METTSCKPDLSIIVVAVNDCSSIYNLIKHLGAQTIVDKIELIILTAPDNKIPFERQDKDSFFDFQISHVDSELSLGEVKAIGLRSANAPVVVFLEDHVFPEPGFAEALVKNHGRGLAVVGPVMRNFNPASKIGWAQFLLFFYPWLEPASRKEVEQLTWNSSSYRKNLLLEFGPNLPKLLRAENLLQAKLRMKGYKILLEPNAVCYHLNFTRLTPWLLEIFNVGCVFGHHRSRSWGTFRKVIYCLGAPLIPLVKLWRILPHVRKADLGEEKLLKILPFMMLGLVVNASGELLSYGCGRALNDYYFKLSAYHEANLAETVVNVNY